MRLLRDESGIVVVEAAFWLPILILAYFSFIVLSLYVTQRVVLDRAVERTCLEASAWLSDIHKTDTPGEFSGTVDSFSVDPYRNLVGGLINEYHPMSKSAFDARIKEKVKQNAGWSLVGGRKGVSPIDVSWEYKYYLIFGELTVSAKQKFIMPISFWFADAPDSWTFYSEAKSMVFDTDSLINDVDFVLEVVKKASGGVLDIDKVRDFVGNLPDKLNDSLSK